MHTSSYRGGNIFVTVLAAMSLALLVLPDSEQPASTEIPNAFVLLTGLISGIVYVALIGSLLSASFRPQALPRQVRMYRVISAMVGLAPQTVLFIILLLHS